MLHQRKGPCSARWGETHTELSSQQQCWLLIETLLTWSGLKSQCTKQHTGYLEQIPQVDNKKLTWEDKKHISPVSETEKVDVCSFRQEKQKTPVLLPASTAISVPTWSYSEAPGYNGQPKNSSAMTHPNDHISIASQNGKPRIISGALQRKRLENISNGSRSVWLAWGAPCRSRCSWSCLLPTSVTAPVEPRAPPTTNKASANQAWVSVNICPYRRVLLQCFTKRQPFISQQFAKERTTIIFIRQAGKLSMNQMLWVEGHPIKVPTEGSPDQFATLWRKRVDSLWWSILCSRSSVGFTNSQTLNNHYRTGIKGLLTF